MRVFSVLVWRCLQVCVLVCWSPKFQPFVFLCSLCLLLLLLYHVLCITPSPKLSSSKLCGRHVTTAVAQQDGVDHYVRTTHVCDVCALGRCAGVCESVDIFACWRLTVQLSFTLFCLLAAAAISCCLYHTVPHVLELLLCGSHGTTAVAP